MLRYAAATSRFASFYARGPAWCDSSSPRGRGRCPDLRSRPSALHRARRDFAPTELKPWITHRPQPGARPPAAARPRPGPPHRAVLDLGARRWAARPTTSPACAPPRLAELRATTRVIELHCFESCPSRRSPASSALSARCGSARPRHVTCSRGRRRRGVPPSTAPEALRPLFPPRGSHLRAPPHLLLRSLRSGFRRDPRSTAAPRRAAARPTSSMSPAVHRGQRARVSPRPARACPSLVGVPRARGSRRAPLHRPTARSRSLRPSPPSLAAQRGADAYVRREPSCSAPNAPGGSAAPFVAPPRLAERALDCPSRRERELLLAGLRRRRRGVELLASASSFSGLLVSSRAPPAPVLHSPSLNFARRAPA